jgi:hypothetical protein
MTSLAISLGALPIAMSLGAASTSRIGMGVVIVGGTIFSLVLTLFVIPALYFMWSRAKNIILNLNTSKNMKMKVNKMNNYKVLIQSLILFLFCVVKMNAQELLTIEDAVKIALENNYAIKIAANELTIGKTNVSIGMQMLPRATASIIDNNNINLSQTRTDGTINSLDNAKNNSLNYGVNLDWTVLTALKCSQN